VFIFEFKLETPRADEAAAIKKSRGTRNAAACGERLPTQGILKISTFLFFTFLFFFFSFLYSLSIR